ncbi:hypothetical protein BEL04_13270 [Mucilaginibacter sp. PPCGB 2223]|uniref:type II toxin-antitoxin system RelE/ParE family toxin n=1 Tax=Mucilaginibacter sp. PPCGB 2223 TaxID=1886027 RepID=UPI000826CDC0|nr:type II toxin-antitoxin system RelE/ParE family toxin [Mucilaginibacter sp. PPCGB 2223]OCX52429.1 hypothetical protein BEL04_13270 [Mucilaginibacter sp. PPCGB 2223]
MVKIIFSRSAKRDLKEIFDFIKRDSIRYAVLEKQHIIEAIDKLLLHPEKGKVFEGNPAYRELVFRNYRIIYRIVSDVQLRILTIQHHARSAGNNPAFKDDE